MVIGWKACECTIFLLSKKKNKMMERHYNIEGLNFRDFWDICSHYQKIHPKYRSILYTVEGLGITICEEEGDVSTVLAAIGQHDNQVRRYVARFYMSPHSEPGDYGNAKIEYLPAPYDFRDAGLYYHAENEDKILLYQLDGFLKDSFNLSQAYTVELEYGIPCEVLCAVIDMRGFSIFCEQPSIESPYTCGVLTAFYAMVRRGFQSYPPDLVKFLGDGVLVVWQTSPKDRNVAIQTCLEGLEELPGQWRHIINGPEFTHGAPEAIGSGVSFGLASKISIDNDYIGRPVNLSSRLCAQCPPGRVYIAKSVPGIEEFAVKPGNIHVKSFGEQPIWILVSSF